MFDSRTRRYSIEVITEVDIIEEDVVDNLQAENYGLNQTQVDQDEPEETMECTDTQPSTAFKIENEAMDIPTNSPDEEAEEVIDEIIVNVDEEVLQKSMEEMTFEEYINQPVDLSPSLQVRSSLTAQHILGDTENNHPVEEESRLSSPINHETDTEESIFGEFDDEHGNQIEGMQDNIVQKNEDHDNQLIHKDDERVNQAAKTDKKYDNLVIQTGDKLDNQVIQPNGSSHILYLDILTRAKKLQQASRETTLEILQRIGQAENAQDGEKILKVMLEVGENTARAIRVLERELGIASSSVGLSREGVDMNAILRNETSVRTLLEEYSRMLVDSIKQKL